MAERRMFAKSIVLSDAFLDLPMSTRCLYFTLNMFSDDEGVVNNPKSIMRQCGATEDDIKLLIVKKFVIPFENEGLIVIKHWYIHNYIQKDRLKPSKYHDVVHTLELDENKAYTQSCIQNVYKMDTQVRLGKDNISKDNNKHKYGEYKNVCLTDEQMVKLQNEFPDWEERIERVSEYCASTGKTYKDYLATIRNWAKKEKPTTNKKVGVGDILNL